MVIRILASYLFPFLLGVYIILPAHMLACILLFNFVYVYFIDN